MFGLIWKKKTHGFVYDWLYFITMIFLCVCKFSGNLDFKNLDFFFENYSRENYSSISGTHDSLRIRQHQSLTIRNKKKLTSQYIYTVFFQINRARSLFKTPEVLFKAWFFFHFRLKWPTVATIEVDLDRWIKLSS